METRGKKGVGASGNRNKSFSSEKRYGKPIHTEGYRKPAVNIPVNRTARFAALMAFEDVINKDTYASMALDARFGEINLSQNDKRLASSITYRTLENAIRIDEILGRFLEKKEDLPPQILDILRISVCQIFFHDRIPENAIVDEAVKIVRFLKNEAFTGLVNGVLRNILRNRNSIPEPDRTNLAKYLSFMYSYPEWLVIRLIDDYGAENAEKICSFRKEKHYITIRPNLIRFSEDSEFEKTVLTKKVWTWEKSILPHAYRVYNVSDLARDADYLNGNFSVQGESSMACVLSAAPKAGMKVLDCCAAPGGKTAYMAEIMKGTGRIYAWDLHDHRVALIRSMQKRLGLENIRPAVRDACIPKEDLFGSMDLVLLDAPCSNLGVIDDKPDVKLRITEGSVQELKEIQQKLLQICSSYVKKDGVLVYSTCSILNDENEGQIIRFLKEHPDFEMDLDVIHLPTEMKVQKDENGIQILPYLDGMEGFFIARMRRIR